MSAPSSSPAPSASALRALARAELKSLASMLRKAAEGSSVHGARRKIKRLRSLLRLLREAMGEDAFHAANGALRAAADALAGQRRAEALVTVAGKLGGRHDPYWLKVAEAHRDGHHGAHASHDGPLTARSVLQTAQDVVNGLRLTRGSSAAIGQAFSRSYRKARRQLTHALDSGDAEELHEARKHVIHHLHHLQILGGCLRRPEKRTEALEALREALGDLNDLDELSRIAAAEGTPPEHAARRMRKRRDVLLKRARRSANSLFRSKAKAFRKRIGAMWWPDKR